MKIWRTYYVASSLKNSITAKTFPADFTVEMVLDFLEKMNGDFPVVPNHCFVKLADAIEVPDA